MEIEMKKIAENIFIAACLQTGCDPSKLLLYALQGNIPLTHSKEGLAFSVMMHNNQTPSYLFFQF